MAKNDRNGAIKWSFLTDDFFDALEDCFVECFPFEINRIEF